MKGNTLTGDERLLTRNGSRRGTNPSIAISAQGQVIVIYEGTGDDHVMWYVTGALNGQGEIVGTEHRFTWDEGVTPCAAFDAAGRVLIVYSNADNGDLSYVYGTFNGEGAVAGQKFSLTTATGKRRGYMPSAAFYSRTGVIIMYQGTEDEKIWYVYGNIDPTTRFSGSERLLDMSFNRW